jgi:hypothetical protein
MIITDPHHPYIEWNYNCGSFFTRKKGTKKWQQVKRFHATCARVTFLYDLMNGVKMFKTDEK